MLPKFLQPGIVAVCGIFVLSACAPKAYQYGKASYYGDQFDGRKTASGTIFRQNKRTAAHKTLPFGTKVTVKNNKNKRRVKVVITDRGPFVAGRIIDLSKKAARRVDMVEDGVVDVTIKYRKPKRKTKR